MARCLCKTNLGKQCSRKAVSGSKFCYQHKNCKTKYGGKKTATSSVFVANRTYCVSGSVLNKNMNSKISTIRKDFKVDETAKIKTPPTRALPHQLEYRKNSASKVTYTIDITGLKTVGDLIKKLEEEWGKGSVEWVLGQKRGQVTKLTKKQGRMLIKNVSSGAWKIKSVPALSHGEWDTKTKKYR